MSYTPISTLESYQELGEHYDEIDLAEMAKKGVRKIVKAMDADSAPHPKRLDLTTLKIDIQRHDVRGLCLVTSCVVEKDLDA